MEEVNLVTWKAVPVMMRMLAQHVLLTVFLRKELFRNFHLVCTSC